MSRVMVTCCALMLMQGCATMPAERAAAAHYCTAVSVDPCFDGTLGGQCLQCP